MSQANKWEWVKDESYCCSLRSGTGRTVMEPMSHAGETWISVLPEDAKKIEAAPELLEALVDVMFRHVPFSNKSEYAEKARAAIQKALGTP